ncbi:MAG TPA: M56 family metallopeptidase [Gemmatimonadaceae bacterium]|nr:M56 family metallopeptidase [Gemmatimonadaceae bacterium]
MLCILYVNAVAALLGAVGTLVERILPANASRRWVWCVAIALSVAIPPIYQANHTSTVTQVASESVHGKLGHTLMMTSLSVINAGWWGNSTSLDKPIEVVWMVGSALVLLLGLANALRVWYALSISRKSRGPTTVDGVPVVVTDSIGPATVGVFRSRVLVPRWVLALPGVQRRYVLRHEDEHRRSHDALLLFVASLPLVLTPWNIALWWQLRRMSLAVEMDCDKRVVSALGDPNAYGELLFKVAQAANRGLRLQPAFLGRGMLERRLTSLLAPEPLRNIQRFLLPVVASVLLYIVFSMPHPVPDATLQPRAVAAPSNAVTGSPASHSHLAPE